MMQKDLRPEFLPLIRSDEFLPRISRWSKVGGYVIVGSVAAITVLASSIEYNVTVRSQAMVRPTGDLRIVQAASEGTIEAIEVKTNQQVKIGDPIAYINSSELENRKRDLESKIVQGQAQLAQIDAQIRAIDTQIAADADSNSRAVAAAQADIQRINRELSDRREAAQAQVQQAQVSLDFAKQGVERYAPLVEEGVISRERLSEREQAVKQAEAQLEQARLDLEPGTEPIAVAQQQVERQRAQGEASVALLRRQREELVQRQIQIRDEMNRANGDIKQVDLALTKTVIRASVNGIILNLNLRNPGQVVRQGEAIAQIAPVDTPFTIVAYVPTQERAKVEVGQKVQMRISAYPYPDYGVLKGKVLSIAPDVTQPPAGNPNGDEAPVAQAQPPSYEVRIQPEKPYLVKSDRQYPIQAGMEARADIISREETVLTFVLRRMRLIADM